MVLAVAPPLVLPAHTEPHVAVDGVLRICERVTPPGFLFDLIQPNAADSGWRPGEIPVDQIPVQTHGLEDLSAAIALDRRDAHLGHDLDNAFVRRLDEVLHRGVIIDGRLERVLSRHVGQSLEREVRVDCAGAVPNEQREMRHFPGLSGLDEDPDLGPRPFPDQMVVHASRGQQAWNRGVLRVDASVRENQDRAAFFYRPRRSVAQLVYRLAHQTCGAGIE